MFYRDFIWNKTFFFFGANLVQNKCSDLIVGDQSSRSEAFKAGNVCRGFSKGGWTADLTNKLGKKNNICLTLSKLYYCMRGKTCPVPVQIESAAPHGFMQWYLRPYNIIAVQIFTIKVVYDTPCHPSSYVSCHPRVGAGWHLCFIFHSMF